MQQNPQTKVQCILNVEMIQNRIGEDDVTSDPFFRSGQKENLGNNFEIAEEMIQEMIEAMENYNKRGSNWIFKKAIRLEVNFVRWKPLSGSGWIPMPEKLAQKKAIINIKNTDNFCFKLCMARAKNPVKSHPEVVTEKLRRQAEEFDWTGCTFPMAVDKIKFFEKRNNVSVNVYYWDKAVYPLKITKEEKPFHVDLLLLKKDSQTHFALIKNFSRLASSQVTGGKNRKILLQKMPQFFPPS